MSRAKRIIGLVLLAAVIGCQGAAGQDVEPSRLRVLLLDDAGVPAGTLERAQQEADGVFRRSNIAFSWIQPGTCEQSCLVLKIVSKPIGALSRNPKIVGVAPGTREARGTIAFVFYDRIRVYSAELRIETWQMLGYVMAHELGHLLLPYGAHSVAGIMRPSWDRLQANRAAESTLRFTADQASLIRERLQASATPIAHAR
jgi:hypothetical protein